MLEKLFPDIYIKSIVELPIEELKKRGIKALVFDIDNTIYFGKRKSYRFNRKNV